MAMFWRSGSTSKKNSDLTPEGRVLWVVRDGQVLASSVQAQTALERIFPARIENFWTSAAVIYGRSFVVGTKRKHSLYVIQLDSSFKVVKLSTLSPMKMILPTTKTRVMVVGPDELLRRFVISVGDQFELRT